MSFQKLVMRMHTSNKTDQNECVLLFCSLFCVGLSLLEKKCDDIRLFQKLLPAPEGFNGCFSSLRPNRPQSGSRELTPFLLTAADAIPLVLACYWRLLSCRMNLQSFHFGHCLKEYNYKELNESSNAVDTTKYNVFTENAPDEKSRLLNFKITTYHLVVLSHVSFYPWPLDSRVAWQL